MRKYKTARRILNGEQLWLETASFQKRELERPLAASVHAKEEQWRVAV